MNGLTILISWVIVMAMTYGAGITIGKAIVKRIDKKKEKDKCTKQ